MKQVGSLHYSSYKYPSSHFLLLTLKQKKPHLFRKKVQKRIVWHPEDFPIVENLLLHLWLLESSDAGASIHQC